MAHLTAFRPTDLPFGQRVFLRRGLLYGSCTLLATIEAIALWVPGFGSALPLAPQIVAPSPFGAYHDLRWVFGYSTSWFAVAWQLALLLIVRTAITAGLALLAWPRDVEAPPPRLLVGRCAAAVAVTVAAMSPWATLAFASSAVSFSWFMLGSIIAAAATALVLPTAFGAGRWWRDIMPWRAILFTLATWVALMVEALVISYSPGWVAIVSAAAGGALNALLWHYQVVTIVHAPVKRWRFPTAPIAVVGVLAIFLVGGGLLLGSSGSGQSQQNTTAQQSPAATLPAGVPVMYVPGYSTTYRGGAFHMLGIDAWHYSYAGLTPSGQPAPYSSLDTHQSLAASVQALQQQVQAYHAEANAPIALIADSEGTVVVRRYLEQTASPPVLMVIETSPLMRPGRVYYPRWGSSGAGTLGGAEARGIIGLLQVENGTFTETVSQPFVRSVVDLAGHLRGDTMCPSPNVPVFAFVPFEGALTVFSRPVAHIPWTAVPGYHATLLSSATVQRDVVSLIRTGKFPTHTASSTVFGVISGAAAAWQQPAYPLSFRSSWYSPPNSDAAFSDWQCHPGS